MSENAAPVGIQDLELPKTLLTRIAKSVLPDGAMLQKESKDILSKSTTLFVSYLTATALDMAEQAKHKNIATDDVFSALTTLELDVLIPKLREHLAAHQQAKRDKKAATATSKAGTDGVDGGDSMEGVGESIEGDEEEQ